MQLSLNNSSPTSIETACLVVAVFADGDFPAATSEVDAALNGRLRKLVDSGDILTGVGKTSLLVDPDGISADRVLAVGCGKRENWHRVSFDKACSAAGKFLRDHAVTEAHVCIAEVEVEDLDAHWRTRHAALAIARSNYLYTATKERKQDDPAPLASASFAGDDALEPAIAQARGIAAGYLRARDLGDLPPNICTPAYLAQQARDIADAYDRVSIEVLERDQLAELGMDALLAVSQGSELDPKFIILNYSGGAEGDAPIVLVGKGITFDTGGISIKPRENMDQMKYDMCGAAGVIGAFEACVHIQLPINVITIVAAVENMPDGRAYRPGDVITSMSGQTIEVLNTDAEGRMILCDSLTYAERFEPKALIDAATLTGACVIALGHPASGLMTKHDDLADELLAAGQTAVDRAWRMPLWDDYQEQIDTPFADMKNVGGMPAGSITAGCFLSRFAKKQRWAHLDVAGSAWKWGQTEGATGRPTGLLAQYLIDQAGG